MLLRVCSHIPSPQRVCSIRYAWGENGADVAMDLLIHNKPAAKSPPFDVDFSLYVSVVDPQLVNVPSRCHG